MTKQVPGRFKVSRIVPEPSLKQFTRMVLELSRLVNFGPSR